MFTKKEKLLIRPWIEFRYKNHRDKVLKMGPAIDFHPPAAHNHVTLKLKKAQKELERQEQIRHENIRLLQRLGAIMNSKRIDNYWTQPRPNFLSREPIYDYVEAAERARANEDVALFSKSAAKRRQSKSAVRCSACAPELVKFEEPIDDVRVPFAPPQQTKNIKLRGIPSEGHVCCVYCC